MAAIFLTLKTGIYIERNGVGNLQSHNRQCRREGGDGGAKYRVLKLRKEARGPIMLHIFPSL